MMEQTSGYISLEDGNVYYEMAGEGEPLVFLHAGFVDSRMWDDQWDEFSPDYSVIRFDMRGFGRSDPPSGPVSRRQELYRVLERVGVSRAVLVGCSIGGETALDAALERPELVSGLVIVAAAPDGFEMQGEPPRYLIEMLAAVERGDLDLASELMMRIWVDGSTRQPQQVDPLVRRRAAEMNRPMLAKGTWGLTLVPLPDPLEPPAVRRLEEINVPTLVIAGELDNPEILRAADLMAGAIPGAQKVILPGSAHLPSMEKPAEFNQAVREYLLRQDH